MEKRDMVIDSIIRRLQAIPGLRDLQEMFEAGQNEAESEQFKAAKLAEKELLNDAAALLDDEIRDIA